MEDDLVFGMNEVQKIVLIEIKKTVSGLSVREAKEVLLRAVNEIEDETIVCRPS
ncbi:hypothetical protein [Mucilaginibacter sp. 3215]|uniref:hypothetical protein n=1 Tax=Mucilaginibacter sp. 3215 TaxID=3373912 RepID=UPI003D194D2A